MHYFCELNPKPYAKLFTTFLYKLTFNEPKRKLIIITASDDIVDNIHAIRKFIDE